MGRWALFAGILQFMFMRASFGQKFDSWLSAIEQSLLCANERIITSYADPGWLSQAQVFSFAGRQSGWLRWLEVTQETIAVRENLLWQRAR